MGKKVVTIDEMIELAIGTPESAVNFLMLQKVLKLIARYCCKMDLEFEMDMDNLKADITAIGNSRSSDSFSESQRSLGSVVDSGQSDTKNANDVQTERQNEKDSDNEKYIDNENEKKHHITDEVDTKESRSVNEKESEKEESVKKVKTEDSIRKDNIDKKESERHRKQDVDKVDRKESEGHRKRDESSKKSSDKNRKRSSENVKKKDSQSSKRRESDSTKNRMHTLEDLSKKTENRTNDLETHLKELADRVENITKTISSHLDEKHLADLNGEIEKLKKNMEDTTDQCYEVTNTINDQSSQIQEIVATINNIQLRKVENEELIDLLSGKADHSFVDEKVSINTFDEIIQELRDTINEGTIQIDTARLETNNSLDEIKQELHTKLLAEEFDNAKTKIYKELIKLTEQQALILAQQNEHVSAGAKMRNLNCFACDNDVVMLLEEETIPKFRGLKSSLQPLEPLVGSKLIVGKNAPEWKDHKLKAKGFTRASKASRFNQNSIYEKPAYVKGKNGCMYKGNVGCDNCEEGMNELARKKKDKCCDADCCNTVEAKNIKNISKTSKMKCCSKIIEKTEIGDVPKSYSTNVTNGQIVQEQIPMINQNLKIEDLNDVEPTSEITVKVEPTEIVVYVEPTVNMVDASVKNEPVDEIMPIKTENESDQAIKNNESLDVPQETNVSANTDAIVKTEADVENPADATIETDPTITNNQQNNVSVVPDEAHSVPDNNV